jgi:hypothetical protein
MTKKKWARDDEIYKLKPHEEKFLSKVLPNRFPSENTSENFNAPTIRTKYGLYTGRFDKPGTKARQWITKPDRFGKDLEDDERRAWILKTGRAPDDEERFPELLQDPRPRFGYAGKATSRANDDSRAIAASQRNFDTNRPRNTWSTPEMGFHYTHR